MAISEKKREAPMMAEPQKEHQWLEKLVGDWTYESEAPMGLTSPLRRPPGRKPYGLSAASG
jgi:hypothetical protein